MSDGPNRNEPLLPGLEIGGSKRQLAAGDSPTGIVRRQRLTVDARGGRGRHSKPYPGSIGQMGRPLLPGQGGGFWWLGGSAFGEDWLFPSSGRLR